MEPMPTGGLSKRTKVIIIVVITLLIIAAVVLIYMRRQKKNKAAESKTSSGKQSTLPAPKNVSVSQMKDKPVSRPTVALKK
jgi:flagellar basal body-associated protein FliL